MENQKFFENLIIKSALTNNNYLAMICNSLEPSYFSNSVASKAYTIISDYYKNYKEVPDPVLLYQDDAIKDYIKTEIDGIDFDSAKNLEYMVDNTDEFIKTKALENAIIESALIVKDKNVEEMPKIRKLIEEALIKTIKVDLGTNYFSSLFERLDRIFRESTKRIPTYFPVFDEFINGGFTPYTLNVILAKIHAGKSLSMINFASRQALQGHNIVMFTLEMSEDAFSQRFDSIFTNLDINKIYLSKKKELVEKLVEIQKNDKKGTLFIKQFPTGTASVNHFRSYLNELSMRGIKIDIIYADYINLMKPSYAAKGEMYQDIKRISEELRALSLEYKAPVVSVTQLNRGGSMVDLNEVDFAHTSESLALAATADTMFVLGTDSDMLIYQSEMHYKIIKNRLGGRIGDVEKFYLDSKSLKMWDSSELDSWMSAAMDSGGNTELVS